MKLAVFITCIVVFTLTGPFGTYEQLDLTKRFAFWVMCIGGVGFFMEIFVPIALTTPRLGKLGQVQRVAVGSAIAALPGVGLVIFVNEVFRPYSSLGPAQFPQIWLEIFVIGILVSSVEFIDWREGSEAEIALPRSVFHKRLNPKLGDDIISISMQDHYAEVTTSLGSQLILMRFNDVLAELSGIDGYQTHRSHWASAKHAKTVEKNGAKLVLRLSDDRTIPLSAARAKQVRADL